MLSPWPRVVGSTAKRLLMAAGPTEEPISFDMAKTSLKVSFNSNSYIIRQRIATARQLAEKHIRRKLVQQVWDMFLDDEAYVSEQPSYMPWITTGLYAPHHGHTEITLPFPPVRQVIGVYTTDDTGVETVVDPSVYYVTRSKEPCRIRLAPGQVWPIHRGGEGLRIRFSCGYATPFSVNTDGTVLASQHGYQNGDYVQFSSHDGTLPAPLELGQNYLAANVSAYGFAVQDLSGNTVTLDATEWTGTGFLGEVPSPILQAVSMICALNQATEIPSRIPGTAGSSRLSPIELPIEPADLLAPYIAPYL